MNPHRWNVWVKIEVKLVTEVINLTAEEEDEDERKIVCEQPNSTWDNYFSGYQIMNRIGQNFQENRKPLRQYRGTCIVVFYAIEKSTQH